MIWIEQILIRVKLPVYSLTILLQSFYFYFTPLVINAAQEQWNSEALSLYSNMNSYKNEIYKRTQHVRVEN